MKLVTKLTTGVMLDKLNDYDEMNRREGFLLILVSSFGRKFVGGGGSERET